MLKILRSKNFIVFLSITVLAALLQYVRQYFGLSTWDENRYLNGILLYDFHFERTIIVDFLYFPFPMGLNIICLAIFIYTVFYYRFSALSIVICTPFIVLGASIASKEQIAITALCLSFLLRDYRTLSFGFILLASFIRPICIIIFLARLNLKFLPRVDFFILLIVFFISCLVILLPSYVSDFSANFSSSGNTNRNYFDLIQNEAYQQKLKLFIIGLLGIVPSDVFFFNDISFVFILIYQLLILSYLIVTIWILDRKLLLTIILVCFIYTIFAGAFLYGNVGSSLRYNVTLLFSLYMVIRFEQFKRKKGNNTNRSSSR